MTETLTSDDSTATPGGTPKSLAFAIVCSPGERGRLGDVCIVPPARAGTGFILGRGPSGPNDPHPRLEFACSRAGTFEMRPPLASPRLSRVQLVVTAGEANALRVRNVGRCRLFCNGVEVESATLAPGDTLRLGRELVLVCVRRPISERSLDSRPPPMAFGESDAHGIVGESPSAWDLRRRIALVAGRPEHVLVTGDSGTGKELVACALHALSPRARMPLVARNAATFPETLVDAELFGHARNYPNAGMPERRGLIGEAAGGTLFLDELADLPATLQTHLLRVLDHGEYQRLGDSTMRTSDFRFVGATNRPAQLREDLAARLKLVLRVPGLRERVEDIPLIAVHLLRSIARRSSEIAARLFDNGDVHLEPRIAPSFMDYLVRRPYATNVRELEALLWEAITEGPEEELDRAPARDSDRRPAAKAAHAALRHPPSAEAIRGALVEHGGSLDRTWRALGLSSRHALRRLMGKYGLDRPKG